MQAWAFNVQRRWPYVGNRTFPKDDLGMWMPYAVYVNIFTTEDKTE